MKPNLRLVNLGFRFAPGLHKHLYEPDFTQIDLSATNLSQADLSGTDLEGADLKGASLTDVTFIAPSTIEVECLLDFSDFNDDGFGNAPEIYEIGIFSDHPVESGLASDQGLMVAYGTFPVEVKDNTKQILNVVRIIF